MAKFKKPIVSAGVYAIPTEAGPRTELISEERLRNWAKTFSSMKKKGLNVPAPWKHEKESIPVQIGSDGTLPRSDINGGYWERLWVEDLDGVPTLFGEVEAPGTPEDMGSPAGKVGKTVKETSIYVRPEFVDGSGEKWQDAIMHIAMVTHPVERNQRNFEQVSEGIALSMAMQTHSMAKNPSYKAPETSAKGADESNTNSGTDQPSDNSTGKNYNLQTLIDTLKRVAKIVLPSDTDESCLSERLLGALLQKEVSEQPETDTPDSRNRKDPQLNTTKKPPEGAKVKSAPVVMALTDGQVKAIVEAKVVNPDTGKPFEVTELAAEPVSNDTIMSHPAFEAMATANKSLLNVVTEQKVAGIRNRVSGLIRQGKITKDYAEKTLIPMLTGFQMSFGSDGKPQTSQLELLLDGLESAPVFGRATTSGTQPAVTHLLGNLADPNQILNALAMNMGSDQSQFRIESQPSPDAHMSEADADKLAKEFMGIS